MAKRRKPLPPIGSDATPVPAPGTVDPDWLAKNDPSSFAEFDELLVDDGLSLRTPATAAGQVRLLERLKRWLFAINLDITAVLVDVGRHHLELDASVVHGFLIQIARPGYISRSTWLQQKGMLITALKHERISVVGLNDKFLLAVADQLDTTDPRPTAPVFMGYGLEDIRAELAAEPDGLWRACMLAFHLTAHWFGGRCAETVCNLRWSDLELDSEHLTVVWPPSKYQPEPKAVRVRVADLPDDINPSLALDELRTASADAGLDVSDDARIFPDCRYEAWSVTHVEDLEADQTFAPDHSGESRTGRAREVVAARYRAAWIEAALRTEWSQTVGYRRVAPHGLRRGVATLTARNGGSMFEVAAVLRHGEAMSATCRYIDPNHNDYQAVVQLLVPDAEPAPVPKSVALEAGQVPEVEDEDYDGLLPVHDWAAGCVICKKRRVDLWSHRVEGEDVVLCGYHLAAYTRGDENWRGLRPCHVWGVTIDGETHTCNREFASAVTLSDGTTVDACEIHGGRLRRCLERGEQLTLDEQLGLGRAGRAVGAPIASGCGVWGVIDGVVHTCDGEFQSEFTTDDGTVLPSCKRHINNFDNARKRGEKVMFDEQLGLGELGKSIRRNHADTHCKYWVVVDGERHECNEVFKSNFPLKNGDTIPCCRRHYHFLARARSRGESVTVDPQLGVQKVKPA